MKTSNSLMIGIGLLIAFAAPASAADTSKDEMQIKAALASITKAYIERDAVGAMAPYVKDDSLVEFDLPPPLSVIGYAGSLKTTEDVINATEGPITIDYSDTHVTVDHRHAYAYSYVHVAATMKDGSKIDLRIRSTNVWEKKNGQWLIIHEHNSAPIDMKTGKADMHAPNVGTSAVPFSNK